MAGKEEVAPPSPVLRVGFGRCQGEEFNGFVPLSSPHHPALALALKAATGGFSAPALAKEKKPEAPKIQPSKAFIPVYVAANKAIEEAAKRQDDRRSRCGERSGNRLS